MPEAGRGATFGDAWALSILDGRAPSLSVRTTATPSWPHLWLSKAGSQPLSELCPRLLGVSGSRYWRGSPSALRSGGGGMCPWVQSSRSSAASSL